MIVPESENPPEKIDELVEEFHYSNNKVERVIEALLFASPVPVSVKVIKQNLPKDCDLSSALRNLDQFYKNRGVNLVKVNKNYAFRTSPDLGFLFRREVEKTKKLSKAATETLAIIVYHQPVTRAEIELIRGVTVSPGTIDVLMEKGWVGLGRRRMSPGKPVTFVATDEFLDHFGLTSVNDLPGLEELKQSGLLNKKPLSEIGSFLSEKKRNDHE